MIDHDHRDLFGPKILDLWPYGQNRIVGIRHDHSASVGSDRLTERQLIIYNS